MEGLRVVSALIVTAILTVGCAGLVKEREDVTPFADVTVVLLSEFDFGLERDIALYTAGMWQEDYPPLVEMRELHAALYELAEAIIVYSYKIVELAETQKLKDDERIEALVKYHELLRSRYGRELKGENALEEEERNQILIRMREETNFLDALEIAEPLVNVALNHGLAVLARLSDLQTEIEYHFAESIDARYDGVRAFAQTSREELNQVLEAMNLTIMTRRGDPVVREQLLELPVVSQIVGDTGETDFDAIEAALTKRLTAVSALRREIEPQLERFRAEHEELDRMVAYHDAELRQVRRALIVWWTGHSRMVNGVKVPAEWLGYVSTARGAVEIRNRERR